MTPEMGSEEKKQYIDYYQEQQLKVGREDIDKRMMSVVQEYKEKLDQVKD